MKRILILIALLGIVLTGCEKQTTSQDVPESGPTPEQSVETVQGKWMALSKEHKDRSGQDLKQYDPATDDVPAIIIEDGNFFTAVVKAATEVMLKDPDSSEISLNEDGKLVCQLGYDRYGLISYELRLEQDKLIVIQTYSENDEITDTFIYGRSDFPVKTLPSDLSKNESANCYIVSEPGNYCFSTFYKGNGNKEQIAGSTTPLLDNIVSAEVYFEEYPTVEEEAPFIPNTVLKNVRYEDHYIYFSTAEPFQEGNVLIAAKDASGETVWSWHIWVTDQPEERVYANNAGILMDRNLGAWHNTTPDEYSLYLALGFLYQWGRKDALLHPSDEYINIAATYSYPSMVSVETIGDGIAYTTKHPDVFVETDAFQTFPAWCGTVDPEQAMKLWTAEKTIYDPCPPGWRVPDAIWAKSGFTDTKSSYFYGYMMPASISGKDSWYPSLYCSSPSGNNLSQGQYLTVTRVPDKNAVKVLNVFTSEVVLTQTDIANGAFVRCKKIL